MAKKLPSTPQPPQPSTNLTTCPSCGHQFQAPAIQQSKAAKEQWRDKTPEQRSAAMKALRAKAKKKKKPGLKSKSRH